MWLPFATSLKQTIETMSVKGIYMEEDKKEEIKIVKVTEELIKAKTYEVRGYKDVEEVEAPKKEKIVDDEPIKRVELHAHTMMSQMDGITGIDLGKHLNINTIIIISNLKSNNFITTLRFKHIHTKNSTFYGNIIYFIH